MMINGFNVRLPGQAKIEIRPEGHVAPEVSNKDLLRDEFDNI